MEQRRSSASPWTPGAWAINPRRRQTYLRRLTFGALAAFTAFGLAACSSSPSGTPVSSSPTSSSSPATTTNPTAQYTEYSRPGPYAAGTFEMTVKGDPVSVWYPAPPSAAAGHERVTYRLTQWLPAAIDKLIPATFPDAVTEDAYTKVPFEAGTFPVVLFAHGFSGFPEQSTFLTAHLATWGFIVVAPELTTMDVTDAVEGTLPNSSTHAGLKRLLDTNVAQVEAALNAVYALDKRSGSIFYGHVDTSQAAIVGHSMGGATAVETARTDLRIKVVVSLAGVPTTPLSRSIPILFMTGSLDQTVLPKGVESFYKSFLPGKSLVVIADAGHNVFDDVCTMNHAHGGIPGAITELHLPVPPDLRDAVTDGCNPPDIYPPKVWGLINQATTAELLWGLGKNNTLVGLGAGIDNAFGGLTASYSGDLGSVS